MISREQVDHDTTVLQKVVQPELNQDLLERQTCENPLIRDVEHKGDLIVLFHTHQLVSRDGIISYNKECLGRKHPEYQQSQIHSTTHAGPCERRRQIEGLRR